MPSSLQRGRPPKSNAQAITTTRRSSINDLILAYWQFAKSHYVKDGKPTDTLTGIRVALRPLRQLYGSTPAGDFGPKA